MFVIEVLVFSRAAPTDPLSYRSRTRLAPGTLVEVPLRRQTVRGVVVEVTPVREVKSVLKAASFSLSKSQPLALGALPPALMNAVRATAEYHATSLGSVLMAVLGSSLPETLPKRFLTGDTFVVHPIESPLQARSKKYQSIIEANTKLKKATLLVVPTLAEVDRFATQFKDLKPLILSGGLSAKRRDAALAAAPEASGLVISTPAFAWTPIAKLGTIIIERASAGTYTLPQRPYLDMRYALLELAKARTLPLYRGDYPLPLEYRTHPAAGLAHAEGLGEITLLDVRTDEKQKHDNTWRAVSLPLLTEIRRVHEDGGRVALFTARRGYSPTVICRDCGTAVHDALGSPLSLAEVNGVRVFRSPDGRTIQSTEALCDLCGSWNLLPLGIGVERVEEELRSAFPEATILRFDSDSLATPAAARKAAKTAEVPGTICVGTEFMLPWLSGEEPLALAAIVSGDSLLALPFWRARERLLRIGISLREMAGETIVQTRRPDDLVFSALFDPSSPKFFEEETNLRRVLGYPPFTTLIALQAEGTPAALEKLDTLIPEALAPATVTKLSDHPLTASKVRRTWLLRLMRDAWPDAELAERIARLPRALRVRVDPESFW